MNSMFHNHNDKVFIGKRILIVSRMPALIAYEEEREESLKEILRKNPAAGNVALLMGLERCLEITRSMGRLPKIKTHIPFLWGETDSAYRNRGCGGARYDNVRI